MKIKYNNKQYCVSPCAKDKFERYILNPVTTFIVAAAITASIVLLASIIGFIAEGIYVSFFNGIAFYGLGDWVGLGLIILMLSLLLWGLFITIQETFFKINRYIQYRVSEEYTKRYKPECRLFVECNE